MYWGGGLLLTLLVVSGVISYLGSRTLVLDDVSLKEVISDNSFAIYVDDGTAGDETDDKNYVEYDGDAFPLKADGYKYNGDKSTCIDNNGNVTTDVTLYYNNDMIQISTSETVYCYIYFDLYTTKGDWCLANEITDNLGECAIVMDNYYNDVDSAKTAIGAKDPVDTSEIAPDITYGKSISTNQTVSVSTTSYFVLGADYDFDAEAGYYTLKDTSSPSTLTDEYIGYYTCGDKNSSCAIMYKIISYTSAQSGTSVTQTITSADVYTYAVSSTIDSENGMYATGDDYGTSYYYRGSVKNNYVLFAGYYWRIIRVNGDGSIRMIYAGTDANDISDDYIGTAQFNKIITDPTYVGYKYGTISSTPVVQDSTINYSSFSASTTYYFGTSYEEVGDGTFKLSGSIISGTFSELFGSGGTYESSITNYYTCFSTSSTGTCTLLMKINAYNSSKSAEVYYISYASTSYEDTLTNENSSTIKLAVDAWYEENIKDKYDDEENRLLSEYISTSATFCGDRNFSSGNGYLLTADTFYSANRRLVTLHTPSLYCENVEDRYSVDNGNLDYPIALISADEAAFAGARYANVNVLYYLYTGSQYWTMSPWNYYSSSGGVSMWAVTATGSISNLWATSLVGVRPVINLSSSVKISQGTGTASNPFVVTLD